MQVYVGADQLSIATLEAGMDGVIGGGGSGIMARMFCDIWHLFKQGKRKEAQALQDRMNQWCVPLHNNRQYVLQFVADVLHALLHVGVCCCMT